LKRADGHAANLKRAIANTEERASKERAHFDDNRMSRRSARGARQRGRRQILLEIATPKTSARASEARASKKISKTPPPDQPKRD
jgi:hypothetical protein